ncbi:MAG TPA: energy transducer TonB, partial [Candidatus Krumholzibacteria bacterium]|nr:energy transducer TonB [Candidatus Krumholzibacteria bacterium]
NGFFGGIDSTLIEPPHASPYVTPWDDPPVLVSIDAPRYPEMVRDAGIDGTVQVRVFVALNGHVKDAYVVDGPAALREAALTSARTAYFKPAKQGSHPVEVWVVIPITFQLHDH